MNQTVTQECPSRLLQSFYAAVTLALEDQQQYRTQSAVDSSSSCPATG
jgi:hypothetical protein